MRRATTEKRIRVGGGAGPGNQRGFGLVEALISLALLSFAALGIAQMIVTGVYVSEASEDLTNVTALAAERLEALKAVPFNDLTPGGSTTANVNGFFDTLDLDGDGTAEFVRRWQVTTTGYLRQLDVVVLGPDTATGEARQVQLTARVASK